MQFQFCISKFYSQEILESYHQTSHSGIINLALFPMSPFFSNTFPGNTTSCNIQRETGTTLENGAYVECGTPRKPLGKQCTWMPGPLPFLSGYCPFPQDFCFHTYWLFFPDLWRQRTISNCSWFYICNTVGVRASHSFPSILVAQCQVIAFKLLLANQKQA